MASEVRRRPPQSFSDVPRPLEARKHSNPPHPAGDIKHGRSMQIARGFTLAVFFAICCVAIGITQFLGAPLYFVSKDLYYAYMAQTKQSFGLFITTITHRWGPTIIRISGDASVAGQIRKTQDGLVEFAFPERMVMIANHQIYTDWLYLWWVGYANRPRMHGHVYIILKESLKNIPVLGWGMQFYSFIFMSRKMATDQPRLAYRLQKLKKTHTDPRTGKQYLDPMWLLLFPEGTNASQNGRDRSAAWAAKLGVRDVRHSLLPRSTGIFFCLNALRGSLEYVYDCTVAYEGVPRGRFGEEFFNLSSTYFQGRPPRSVNFYWRRFRVDAIPLHDAAEFDAWLRERWYEKDDLLEVYLETGRFPPLTDAATSGKRVDDGFVETEVRTRFWWEILQIFSVLGVTAMLLSLVVRIWAGLGRLLPLRS